LNLTLGVGTGTAAEDIQVVTDRTDDGSSSGGQGISPIWFALAALCIALLVVFFYVGKSYVFAKPAKKKESARMRHMRRTRGLDAPPQIEPTEEDLEAPYEKPPMPWEQRQSAEASALEAPVSEGFTRLPMVDVAPMAAQVHPSTQPYAIDPGYATAANHSTARFGTSSMPATMQMAAVMAGQYQPISGH